MYNITISDKYAIIANEGNQDKYLYNNEYYKIDNYGCEGIAEELASLILTCSTLNPEEYVIYEHGYTNGKYSCKSKNFIKNDEQFISLTTLYKIKTQKDLTLIIRNMPMEEKINYVINFVKENTGLDITDYLRKCITLDYITRNPDRHFRNLGIKESNGEFSVAPIFDNGQGLMSHMKILPFKSIDDNLDEIAFKPFSDDINEMYDYFGPGFQVDFKQLENLLLQYNIKPNEYGYEQLVILKHQIEKLKNTELDINISLDEKIKRNTLENPEYKIIDKKLILNEAAQIECDELIKNGIINNISQYPAYKDSKSKEDINK